MTRLPCVVYSSSTNMFPIPALRWSPAFQGNSITQAHPDEPYIQERATKYNTSRRCGSSGPAPAPLNSEAAKPSQLYAGAREGVFRVRCSLLIKWPNMEGVIIILTRPENQVLPTTPNVRKFCRMAHRVSLARFAC